MMLLIGVGIGLAIAAGLAWWFIKNPDRWMPPLW